MKWQKVVSVVALAGAAWAGAMAGVASSAATTVVPDKAPDVFVGAGDPLGVYSLKTGELVQTLPAGGTPQVADYGRLVYYLRDAPGLPECDYQVWRVPVTGGTARSLPVRFNNTVMGVSRDGRFLAYISEPGGCHSKGEDYLTIVDLGTLRERVVPLHRAPVLSLAWSSDDLNLILGALEGPMTNGTVLVARGPWSARVVQLTLRAPCPLAAPYCYESDPQYDRAGDLFYIAAVDPNPKRPCAYYKCSSQAYVLTELRHGKAKALATTTGRAGSDCWLTVDAPGTAAVYTVPAGESSHTFIWSEGHVRRLRTLVVQESI